MFCFLVGVIVKQRRVLPVTASWLWVLVPVGVSVCVKDPHVDELLHLLLF